MARMIPDRVHPGTPNSEQRIFDKLRLDPATSDWTVLHSLGLSTPETHPFGEIDFVVLVPGQGVVCVEVKGGRVACDGGRWYTTDRSGQGHELRRSPFQQVRSNLFIIKEAIQAHFGAAAPEASVVLGSGVIFPDVHSLPPSPEFEPWELLDVVGLRRPISRWIAEVLKETEDRLGGRRPVDRGSEATLKSLRNFLRPDFDVGVARATTIHRSEQRIVRLTEEQFDVLDSLSLNKRCMVQGPAGTGKTLLAVEYARRAAASGDRVLLLCFNRLLGQWLQGSATEDERGADWATGSLHSFLRRRILATSMEAEFLQEEDQARSEGRIADFYREGYSVYAQLAAVESGQAFDLLVVDEAQDLLNVDYLDVLNSLVVGGLAGGRWAVFGDFERQAIFGDGDDGPDLLESYSSHHSRLALTRNLRNTRAIGEETALLSGFSSLPYRLDQDECLPVHARYWTDRDHQARQLKESIDELQGDGVAEQDMVILSMRRFEASVASAIQGTRVRKVDSLEAAAPGIRFSTVHAFKGLESAVVLLTDVEDIDSAPGRSLLYVGMSRARSHLILFLRDGLQASVQEAVRRRLLEDWEW